MAVQGTCKCGAHWSGQRMEHCPVAGCHKTFSSSRAGDMHRTGDHAVTFGPDRRRCRTADEMLKVGLIPREHPGGLLVWGRKGARPADLTAAVRTGSTNTPE